MLNKAWDEITSPFQNFNRATFEVWEWISNFTQHFIMNVIIYLSAQSVSVALGMVYLQQPNCTRSSDKLLVYYESIWNRYNINNTDYQEEQRKAMYISHFGVPFTAVKGCRSISLVAYNDSCMWRYSETCL